MDRTGQQRSCHSHTYGSRFDKKAFHVEVNASGNQNLKVNVCIQSQGKIESQHSGTPNTPITLPLQTIRPWSPDTPHLYDVIVKLTNEKGETVDSIRSYAGMRKISLKNENGVQRLALNDKFIFQMGPLDQGYWPDGIYTAPQMKP